MATIAPALPPAVPEWIPVGRYPELRPTGRWFDAVTAYSVEGVRAIARLGERSGPVIDDPEQGLVTWFVRPGSAVGWSLPCVGVLGAGCEIVVPPAAVPDRALLRWVIPPAGDCLTCPALLYDTLALVTGGRRPRASVSTFTSPECLFGEHEACTKAEVPSSPQDSSVIYEPCNCDCHAGAGR
ncbi:hypothetical protein [Streptomyces sp. NBC_01803]|uniref:hypothetical protein n=1 Tax=Streptomyces sp. NBC_01803 TaxID=2975946 RepID=UPI002DDAD35F|nr:hypothetical protein [Streptomyces sp. NBC_01803]WSA43043.1 hypothetical protein OIE51_01835 [Streptomyces sp. NBC_01803]